MRPIVLFIIVGCAVEISDGISHPCFYCNGIKKATHLPFNKVKLGGTLKICNKGNNNRIIFVPMQIEEQQLKRCSSTYCYSMMLIIILGDCYSLLHVLGVLKNTHCGRCQDCICNGGSLQTCHRCTNCGDLQSKCNTHQTVAQQAVTTDPKPVTTNSVSLRSGKCDSVKVFDAVARNEFVLNEHAQVCEGDSSRHGNDAFVMSLCHAPDPSKWIEGELLLKDGVCTSSAEKYTPVFFHYPVPGNDFKQAGILLSCNGTDLKIFKQDCLTTPRVEHVNPSWVSKMYVLTWHH